MHLPTLTLTLALAAFQLTTAYEGDMTHYDLGPNSCNIPAAEGDVVALSQGIMGNGANPNLNAKRGTKITIWNPKTKMEWNATIVDTCMGCKMFDIDASPSLFKKVAPDGDGRVKGIDWGGPAVGG